jgi:hypothetical protein
MDEQASRAMTTSLFFQNLEKMRSKCMIKDDKYWHIEFNESESPLPSFPNKNEDFQNFQNYYDSERLMVKTHDDFTITIRFKFEPADAYNRRDQCHFNGYVEIPKGYLHFNLDYNDDELDFGNVELTYWDDNQLKYGWDHGHIHDANLSIPAIKQRGKCITGPVQVLDEARLFIGGVRTKNNQVVREKKKNQMALLEEELMMEMCHPKRIMFWTQHGFDPFQE